MWSLDKTVGKENSEKETFFSANLLEIGPQIRHAVGSGYLTSKGWDFL